MDIREPRPADAARIREVVRSSFTTSYAISPGSIESILEEEFDESALGEKFDASDTVVLVAETDPSDTDEGEPVLAGVLEATLANDRGEVRWLHVDPERRGLGAGTTLFQAGTDALANLGAERTEAVLLAGNNEGRAFLEQFGYEEVDERETELADESFVVTIYAEPERAPSDAAAGGGASPDPTTRDGETAAVDPEREVESESERGQQTSETQQTSEAQQTSTTQQTSEPEAADPEAAEESEREHDEDHDVPETATTTEGETVYVDADEDESGTEGPFFAAFADSEREERWGFYCGNCGSTDVQMSDMEQVRCQNCGNTHRNVEGYDSSYL